MFSIALFHIAICLSAWPCMASKSGRAAEKYVKSLEDLSILT